MKVSELLQNNPPQQIPVQQPTKLIDKDFEQALEHIDNVRRHALTFAGKEGHNPYIWLSRNVDPLIARYNDGERSSELLKSLLSVPAKVAPTINVKAEMLPPL